MSQDPVVAVPADLELDDRLAGPITFRMAGWLAGAAAGAALGVLSRERLWALPLAAVLVLGGLAGAFWRPSGRPIAAWAGPLWSYRHRRRTEADGTVRTLATGPESSADHGGGSDGFAGAATELAAARPRRRGHMGWAALPAACLAALLIGAIGRGHLAGPLDERGRRAPASPAPDVAISRAATPEQPGQVPSSAAVVTPAQPEVPQPDSTAELPNSQPYLNEDVHDETDHSMPDWPFCGC